MKEDLRQLWSQPDKKRQIVSLQIGLPELKLQKSDHCRSWPTLWQTHRFGILSYYDHPISSGPIKGTNNKIKTLKRQAYGYWDKEFFKLRIMGIHESKFALTG
jgi:transposase